MQRSLIEGATENTRGLLFSWAICEPWGEGDACSERAQSLLIRTRSEIDSHGQKGFLGTFGTNVPPIWVRLCSEQRG